MTFSKQFLVKIFITAGLTLLAATPASSDIGRGQTVSLKQIKITFPAGITREDAQPLISRFAESARQVENCDAAEDMATKFNGVVSVDEDVKLDNLPRPLKTALSSLRIGQATSPFGTISQGIRVVLLCDRS